MYFVTFKVLHEVLSYFDLSQTPFYTLKPIMYPFLIVGC
jgi:hypothetical protein